MRFGFLRFGFMRFLRILLLEADARMSRITTLQSRPPGGDDPMIRLSTKSAGAVNRDARTNPLTADTADTPVSKLFHSFIIRSSTNLSVSTTAQKKGAALGLRLISPYISRYDTFTRVNGTFSRNYIVHRMKSLRQITRPNPLDKISPKVSFSRQIDAMKSMP